MAGQIECEVLPAEHRAGGADQAIPVVIVIRQNRQGRQAQIQILFKTLPHRPNGRPGRGARLAPRHDRARRRRNHHHRLARMGVRSRRHHVEHQAVAGGVVQRRQRRPAARQGQRTVRRQHPYAFQPIPHAVGDRLKRYPMQAFLHGPHLQDRRGSRGLRRRLGLNRPLGFRFTSRLHPAPGRLGARRRRTEHNFVTPQIAHPPRQLHFFDPIDPVGAFLRQRIGPFVHRARFRKHRRNQLVVQPFLGPRRRVHPEKVEARRAPLRTRMPAYPRPVPRPFAPDRRQLRARPVPTRQTQIHRQIGLVQA